MLHSVLFFRKRYPKAWDSYGIFNITIIILILKLWIIRIVIFLNFVFYMGYFIIQSRICQYKVEGILSFCGAARSIIVVRRGRIWQNGTILWVESGYTGSRIGFLRGLKRFFGGAGSLWLWGQPPKFKVFAAYFVFARAGAAASPQGFDDPQTGISHNHVGVGAHDDPRKQLYYNGTGEVKNLAIPWFS